MQRVTDKSPLKLFSVETDCLVNKNLIALIGQRKQEIYLPWKKKPLHKRYLLHIFASVRNQFDSACEKMLVHLYSLILFFKSCNLNSKIL